MTAAKRPLAARVASLDRDGLDLSPIPTKEAHSLTYRLSQTSYQLGQIRVVFKGALKSFY